MWNSHAITPIRCCEALEWGIRKTLLISGFIMWRNRILLFSMKNSTVIVRTNKRKASLNGATQCDRAEEQMENEQNQNHSGKKVQVACACAADVFDMVFLCAALLLRLPLLPCIYCKCMLDYYFCKCEVSLSANYCVWYMREYKWWSPFVWLWAVRKLNSANDDDNDNGDNNNSHSTLWFRLYWLRTLFYAT